MVEAKEDQDTPSSPEIVAIRDGLLFRLDSSLAAQERRRQVTINVSSGVHEKPQYSD
jgi:hypothetical protein